MASSRRLLALGALVLVSCGTELGRTSFDGAGTREVAVAMPSAGEIQLRTGGEFFKSSNRSPFVKQWAITIETVRGGVVTGSRTCDPLDVNLSFSGMESCGGGHMNCTQTYHGAVIRECAVPLEAGPTTLRLTVAPRGAALDAKIKHLDVAIIR
jgi:hypothetical protein